MHGEEGGVFGCLINSSQLLNSIIAVPELATNFDEYQTEQTGYLDSDELASFLKDFQHADDIEVKSWEDAIPHLPGVFREHTKLTFLGFCLLATSNVNSCIKPDKLMRYQDMDQPLSHYWISGSFKAGISCLPIGQRRSPVACVKDLLDQGVRHLHFEVTEDESSEPEVSQEPYSPLRTPLESILKLIRDQGFHVSPDPSKHTRVHHFS